MATPRVPWRRSGVLLALSAAAVLAAACSKSGGDGVGGASTASAPAGASAPSSARSSATVVAGGDTMTVYKSPTCGCCEKWVEHMRANGFHVVTVDRLDVTPVKREHGIGEELASCHTAIVSGYAIEGHVPAADVRRLLAERPAGVRGLAVPGMPSGSPGMEMPGAPPDRYDVVAFDSTGARRVFARH